MSLKSCKDGSGTSSQVDVVKNLVEDEVAVGFAYSNCIFLVQLGQFEGKISQFTSI